MAELTKTNVAGFLYNNSTSAYVNDNDADLKRYEAERDRYKKELLILERLTKVEKMILELQEKIENTNG